MAWGKWQAKKSSRLATKFRLSSTEGTKKELTKNTERRQTVFALLLRVLGVEVPSDLMDERLRELCVKRS